MATTIGSGKRKIHKWKKEEIGIVFNYMMETVQKGYDIEKPTALSYYQILLEKTDLPSSVRAKPLLDKMNKIRSSFKVACAWENQTGQGVKEKDGLVTFRAALLLKCPYYDECKLIWGQKANIVIPYTAASDNNNDEREDETRPMDNNENEWDVGEVNDRRSPSRDRSRSPVSIQDTQESSFDSQGSLTPENRSKSHEVRPRSRHRQSAIFAGEKLRSVCKPKQPTASSIFQQYAITKQEESLEKIELQKQQVRLDEIKMDKQYALKQEKFEYKKMMELERIKAEKDKIEAEKEMFKMKLESDAHLASLRIRELELQLKLAQENKK